MLNASDYFDLRTVSFAEIFEGTDYVWEALKKIEPFLQDNLQPNVGAVRKGKEMVDRTTVIYDGRVIRDGFQIDLSGKKPQIEKDGTVLEGASIIYAGAFLMDESIYIGRGTVVEPGALIKGPAFVGDHTEIRQGAYIRGRVIVGDSCVVGHATEMKSSLMLGESKAGHFAYIGDSILGRVNLGAGTKLANLKMTDTPVVLNIDGKTYKTGLRKFGAVLADGVETGCNSVTSPGTLLGKGCLLYPNGTARGYYPPGMIIKIRQTQQLIDLGKRSG
ncbi:MAG: glucose-1-phosphate thymidylyltransferase [Bacillota bacterium]|nr:glucose-1-phosphate thymidylyltransferase [Bacillota bacterium]